MSGWAQSGEFWAVVAGLLWAVAVILYRLAGDKVPPLTMNLFKGVVALVVFIPLLVAPALMGAEGAGWPDWTADTWLKLIASGVIGITLADTFFFAALNRLGAGLTSVVGCLYFPILAVMANIVLGDQLSTVTVAGAGLIIAGIVLGSLGTAGTRSTEGLSSRDLAIGVLFQASAVLTLAVSVVMVTDIVRAEPVLWTTSVRLAAGTAVIAPIVLLGPQRHVARLLFRPSPLWRYALPGAVLGGALSNLAWIAGFAHTQIAIAAILNQLATIYIFVLAAVVLNEPFTPRRAAAVTAAFAGAAIIIVAG
ncbi:MAG: DMT family transporter [Anaerolineae bacterium]